MNKKLSLILAALFIMSVCMWQVQAMDVEHKSVSNMEDNVPSGYEEIVLFGSLVLGPNPNSITAGANRASVYLHFNQSFGNVNISIYNESGCRVYGSVVDSSVQQTVIISLPNANNGTYLIELNNANGYAEGEFRHN